MSASDDVAAKLARYEEHFKQNALKLVSFLGELFSCPPTKAYQRILETVVFTTHEFTEKMILEWNRSMKPYYEKVQAGEVEVLLEATDLWFFQRIDLKGKWGSPMLNEEHRAMLVKYFAGLNMLARVYEQLYTTQGGRALAAAAAGAAIELPALPEGEREQAEWVAQAVQGTIGALSGEQVAKVLEQLPAFVEAMGGPDRVIEHVRGEVPNFDFNASAFAPLQALLTPDLIRGLVGGLQSQVRGQVVPSKTGEAVPLETLVGDTSEVLAQLVEGKADATKAAELGQKIVSTIDWETMLSDLPPGVLETGRNMLATLGSVSKQTVEEAAEGGEGDSTVDTTQMVQTVQNIMSMVMTPDSPYAGILSSLMSSAATEGGASPLAGIMSMFGQAVPAPSGAQEKK